MTSHINVPIPTRQFLDIVDFLREKNDPRDPVDVISTAIEYWLDNASWKPELLADSDARGYQWKNLFLPDSTQIRMQYKGEYFYAKVESDQIVFKGAPISPGSLANTIAGSSRNAWRDLWIKRPHDQEWKLALECRKEQMAVAEKLLESLSSKTTKGGSTS